MAEGSEKGLCGEAEAYYYDFLLEHEGPAIPKSIADHIGGCAHCREQVDRLKAVLSEAGDVEETDDPDRQQGDMGIIDALSLHFQHTDEGLTCGRVKPFLPSLLIPSLQIRIPTPVTSHVDNCSRCAEDLEALGKLGLTAGQLARLGGLLGESAGERSVGCSRARSKISVLGAGVFEGIDTEGLKHLCLCPRCRDRVYQVREELLNKGFDGESQAPEVSCGDITVADVFDFAVPYGLGPAEQMDASGGPEAIAAHVRSCPQCLEKVQAVHRTVYGVLEREESDVVTVYETGACDAEAAGEAESLYEGYPIRVKVIHRDPAPVLQRSWSPAGLGVALKRGFYGLHLGLFGKVAFLVAALVPLAILFVMSLPSASAVNLAQINKVLALAPNIHVATLGRDGEAPTQELWLSRPRHAAILRRGGERIVYDLANRRKFVLGPDSREAQRFELSDRQCADAERTLHSYLEFAFADVRPDAELTRVPGGDGLEEYELNWVSSPTFTGRKVLSRWKVFVDPATRLPRRAEYFRRESTDAQWRPLTVKRFEYPSGDRFQSQPELQGLVSLE